MAKNKFNYLRLNKIENNLKVRILDENLIKFQYYHKGKNNSFDNKFDNPLLYTTPCKIVSKEKDPTCRWCVEGVFKFMGVLGYFQREDNLEIEFLNQPTELAKDLFEMRDDERLFTNWIVLKKEFDEDLGRNKYSSEFGDKIPTTEINKLNKDLLKNYNKDDFEIDGYMVSYQGNVNYED